jgi:hypothetical protein
MVERRERLSCTRNCRKDASATRPMIDGAGQEDVHKAPDEGVSMIIVS